MDPITAIFGGIRLAILLADELNLKIGGKVITVDLREIDSPEKVESFLAELDESKSNWPDLQFKSPVKAYVKGAA